MKIRQKNIMLFMGLFILGSVAGILAKDEDEYFQQRKAMIENQLEARGIKDKNVFKSMLRVKRHLFVPQKLRNLAYTDGPLPIGEGQTISQPYIVALMTELLELKGTEKVLEIGTGSGYQAAILGELAKEVYTIEILPKLAERSEIFIKKLGYKNIFVKCGDGYLGWPEHAPFDAIIVTCAPEEIPKALIEQLADGGRMVIPVGNYSQELQLIKKTGDRHTVENITPVRFVPMIKGGEKKGK